MDQTRERAAGFGMEFLLVNRSVLVRISGVEELFDKDEIFILAQSCIIVWIRPPEFRATDTPLNLLAVERRVIVIIEFDEHAARPILHLGEIKGAVIVLIERRERRGRVGFRGAKREGQDRQGKAEST